MKRLLVLVLVLVSGSAFSYDYEVYQSAKHLNDSAWNLVNRIEHKSTLSHLSGEARYLANRVSEFKSSVRYANADWRVQRNFELVQRAFDQLDDLLRRNRYARHYVSVKKDVERMRDNYYRARDVFHVSYDRAYYGRHYGYYR